VDPPRESGTRGDAMMRPGDDPKLAPEAEQKLLEKLRREREEKAHALLQAEAQSISAKMAHMNIADISVEAKKYSSAEKALAFSPQEAHVALVLNALLRTCAPPEVKETPASGKGSKKKQNGIKAAAAKAVEGVPPAAAEVRKVLKANIGVLNTATHGTQAGQLALLRAITSWLVSPQGANALASAAKIVEVLYDADQAEEEACKKYWTGLQAQLVREAAELVDASAACETLAADKAAAEEAVKTASAEKANAMKDEKNAELYAQAARCGGNPTKEDEIAEKAALSALKKAKDYHAQTSKVLAARTKNMTETNAEFQASQRVVEQVTLKVEGGAALFAKHAAPFFEWLEQEDEDEEVEVT